MMPPPCGSGLVVTIVAPTEHAQGRRRRRQGAHIEIPIILLIVLVLSIVIVVVVTVTSTMGLGMVLLMGQQLPEPVALLSRCNASHQIPADGALLLENILAALCPQ